MSVNNNKTLLFLQKHHFIITIGLGLLCFIAEGFFLYYFFYRPLTLTKILAELRQQATIEELRVPLSDKLTDFLNRKQKKDSTDWANLRDPFVEIIPVPSPSIPSPISSPSKS